MPTSLSDPLDFETKETTLEPTKSFGTKQRLWNRKEDFTDKQMVLELTKRLWSCAEDCRSP